MDGISEALKQIPSAFNKPNQTLGPIKRYKGLLFYIKFSHITEQASFNDVLRKENTGISSYSNLSFRSAGKATLNFSLFADIYIGVFSARSEYLNGTLSLSLLLSTSLLPYTFVCTSN